jgi:hypothetical protein
MQIARRLYALSLLSVLFLGGCASGSEQPTEEKRSTTSRLDDGDGEDTGSSDSGSNESTDDSGGDQASPSFWEAYGNAVTADGTPVEAYAPAAPGLNFPSPGMAGPIASAVSDAVGRASEAYTDGQSEGYAGVAP